MSRLAPTLAACCLSLLLTIPADAMTDEEEMKLGKQIGPYVVARYGGAMPAKSAAARRVRRIGARLARLTTRPIPVTYGVLENDEMLNAFTAPGGQIYITRRLVQMAETDAQVAAILAHETAHFQLRHSAQMVERHELAQTKVRRVSRALMGDMVDTEEGSALSMATSVAFVLMQRGFSMEKESEADAYAARALSRLGYDPRATITILQKLSYEKQLAGEEEPAFAFHPGLNQRCTDLRNVIARERLVEKSLRYGRTAASRRHR